MATDTAGKWVLGLVIYFFFLFIFFFFITNLSAEYGVSTGGITYSGGSGGLSLDNLGTCGSPREEISIHDFKCKSLVEIGRVYDNNSCEAFQGCSWEEKNAFASFVTFGLVDVTYTCTGHVNLTHYNAGTDIGSLFGLSDFGYFSGNVCEDLTNLTSDQNTCNAFGCTWYNSGSEYIMDFQQLSGTWGLIKSFFTFNVSFGTSSQPLNIALNFLFIVLPLIALIIAVVIFFRG